MKTRRTMLAGAVALVVALTGCGGATSSESASSSNGSPDHPGLAEDWSFPAIDGEDGKEVTYTPIKKSEITESWNMCVLFPHMKDPFWVSANYGTLLEAQRDNLNYRLFEAGGYPNIEKQISQFQDCVNGGYDAIIVGASSATSLCPRIDAALKKGIAVVDLINGVDCPSAEASDLFAHTAISYKIATEVAAGWLVDHVGDDGASVGFFPGPKGAGWSEDAVAGWNEATNGTPVETGDMRRGDYGVEIQQGLIQDSLTANENIDWIFGLSAASEAGLAYLRGANRTDVQLASVNLTPALYEGLEAGDVAGTGMDFAVMQSRMSVDTAVRLLEGQLEHKNIGPQPQILTQDNFAEYPYELLFGPRDFNPTYNWEPSA